MRISYLQHVPFEGPARIADWARQSSHLITGTRLDLEEPLPGVSDFDMLVIMGGPMSVNDEHRCPWLQLEKQLVLDAMAARKPVLGVCLGAQLIASAMGAPVYRCSEKEIGWFSVQRTEGASRAGAFSGFPDTFTPLHWHGETFDLPPGAVRTAASEVCPNQAFQVGDHVVGVQFHLEATEASVTALVENAGADIVGGRFQQPADDIARDAESRAPVLWPLLAKVLEYLTGSTGA